MGRRGPKTQERLGDSDLDEVQMWERMFSSCVYQIAAKIALNGSLQLIYEGSTVTSSKGKGSPVILGESIQ